jgi:hypothetical protein
MESLYNDDWHINFACTNDESVHGLTLEDILNMSDQWWEQCHCFIQIIFPNPMPSKMNPDAPIIEDFSVFDGVLRYEVAVMVGRFLKFLGVNIRKPKYSNYDRVAEWFRPDNHNILRVTRLLIFLKGVGMIAEMNKLKEFLANYQYELADGELRNRMSYTMTIWQNV